MSTSTENTPHYTRAIAQGYFYECPCGELHREIRGACLCRKCRVYLVEPCDTVIDIRDGSVVAGTDPRVIAAEEAREADLIVAARKASAMLTSNPFAGRF